MGLTHFPNGVTSFGIPMLGAGVPAMFGDVYFVDFANGSDGNSGKSMDQATKTLSHAYTKIVSDQNDMILINGDDPVEEDAMITVSSNKTHIIGLGTFGATDPEPRIKESSTGITVVQAATMTITGWANTLTNVRIINQGTDSASVTSLWDKGEGTVFTNCQFAKFSDLGESGVSDVEARGDSTTWRNCKFGVDTLSQTATRPTLNIKGTGGSARMKNNVFEDCYFTARTTQAAKVLVTVDSTNSLAFMNIWKDCIFTTPIISSSSDVQLTVAVESVSGLIEGSMLFVNPATNADSFATTTDRLTIIGHGLAASTTANVAIAITPT